MTITVTAKAINEVRRVMEEQSMPSTENVLEVGVAGGGCSGFSYKLGFKKKTEVDALNETTFTFDDLEVVVSNKAMPYLDGATVDFHDDLNYRGFAFRNPNAKGSCGCGSSFSV